MKLNKAQNYAVAAMVQIAAVQIAANQSQKPLSAVAICERVSLPLSFLQQLLRELTNAGLVESRQGRHGGFKLARPAKQIALFDIVDAVKGGLKSEPVEIVGLDIGSAKTVQRAVDASNASIRKEFKAITLADLRAAKA